MRFFFACVPLLAAVAARADVTPGAPPSRTGATLHRFDGPFAATLTGDALRRLRCVPAFVEAFPDLVSPKEVAARLECRRLPLTIAVAGTPLVEAQIWEGHARFNWNKEVAVLAVRTPRGWWVAPFDYFWENRWNAIDGSHIAVDGVASATGGPPALVVRWGDTTDEWTWDVHPPPDDPHDDDEGRTVTTHALTVVGVGASGVPTMTAPVVVAVEMRSDRDGDSMSARREASFSSGALVVGQAQVAPTTMPRAKWQELVAPLGPLRLPLAFP